MDGKTMFPIEMISMTTTQGDITPIRFRYETPEHELIVVHVDDIHGRKEMTIGKGGSIIYTCSSTIEDTRVMYELRYEIGTHKWIFNGRLS